MQTISLCMIVKNEENNLPKCLSSVRNIVDEIVVVDTGSTDHTKEVALEFTDKVLDFKWVDDFSKARNFSFENASMDYVMWLDADDILLPDDQLRLRQLRENLNSSVDGVMMKYNTGFDANGNVSFSYYRERLVKRARDFKWHEPVHEYLEANGQILQSDVCVTHTKKHSTPSGRNLAIYERILGERGELSPRGLYYYARELKDNGRFADAIAYFNLFLATEKGWVEDNITACLELAVCHQAESQPQQQYLSILRSFLYDIPRAEACCALGYFCKAKQDFARAIFWFELASSLHKPEGNWGFIKEDCWGYTPYIELAVCNDRLGMQDKAEKYNELAGTIKPGDASVEHNRAYFRSLKKEGK